MARIKVNTSYDEWNKVSYSRRFDIVDYLPEHVEVRKVKLDISQPREDVWDYMYFECIVEDEEGERFFEYYAIRQDYDKEIKFKDYQTNSVVVVTGKDFERDEDESVRYDFDFDGIWFADDDEVESYIYENILNQIEGDFTLSEDDATKIIDHFKMVLNARINEDMVDYDED